MYYGTNQGGGGGGGSGGGSSSFSSGTQPNQQQQRKAEALQRAYRFAYVVQQYLTGKGQDLLRANPSMYERFMGLQAGQIYDLILSSDEAVRYVESSTLTKILVDNKGPLVVPLDQQKYFQPLADARAKRDQLNQSRKEIFGLNVIMSHLTSKHSTLYRKLLQQIETISQKTEGNITLWANDLIQRRENPHSQQYLRTVFPTLMTKGTLSKSIQETFASTIHAAETLFATMLLSVRVVDGVDVEAASMFRATYKTTTGAGGVYDFGKYKENMKLAYGTLVILRSISNMSSYEFDPSVNNVLHWRDTFFDPAEAAFDAEKKEAVEAFLEQYVKDTGTAHRTLFGHIAYATMVAERLAGKLFMFLVPTGDYTEDGGRRQEIRLFLPFPSFYGVRDAEYYERYLTQDMKSNVENLYQNVLNKSLSSGALSSSGSQDNSVCKEICGMGLAESGLYVGKEVEDECTNVCNPDNTTPTCVSERVRTASLQSDTQKIPFLHRSLLEYASDKFGCPSNQEQAIDLCKRRVRRADREGDVGWAKFYKSIDELEKDICSPTSKEYVEFSNTASGQTPDPKQDIEYLKSFVEQKIEGGKGSKGCQEMLTDPTECSSPLECFIVSTDQGWEAAGQPRKFERVRNACKTYVNAFDLDLTPLQDQSGDKNTCEKMRELLSNPKNEGKQDNQLFVYLNKLYQGKENGSCKTFRFDNINTAGYTADRVIQSINAEWDQVKNQASKQGIHAVKDDSLITWKRYTEIETKLESGGSVSQKLLEAVPKALLRAIDLSTIRMFKLKDYESLKEDSLMKKMKEYLPDAKGSEWLKDMMAMLYIRVLLKVGRDEIKDTNVIQNALNETSFVQKPSKGTGGSSVAFYKRSEVLGTQYSNPGLVYNYIFALITGDASAQKREYGVYEKLKPMYQVLRQTGLYSKGSLPDDPPEVNKKRVKKCVDYIKTTNNIANTFEFWYIVFLFYYLDSLTVAIDYLYNLKDGFFGKMTVFELCVLAEFLNKANSDLRVGPIYDNIVTKLKPDIKNKMETYKDQLGRKDFLTGEKPPPKKTQNNDSKPESPSAIRAGLAQVINYTVSVGAPYVTNQLIDTTSPFGKLASLMTTAAFTYVGKKLISEPEGTENTAFELLRKIQDVFKGTDDEIKLKAFENVTENAKYLKRFDSIIQDMSLQPIYVTNQDKIQAIDTNYKTTDDTGTPVANICKDKHVNEITMEIELFDVDEYKKRTIPSTYLKILKFEFPNTAIDGAFDVSKMNCKTSDTELKTIINGFGDDLFKKLCFLSIMDVKEFNRVVVLPRILFLKMNMVPDLNMYCSFLFGMEQANKVFKDTDSDHSSAYQHILSKLFYGGMSVNPMSGYVGWEDTLARTNYDNILSGDGRKFFNV